ncbi:MAG: hypothetical protein ACT4NU_06895 [Chromatiales bacterium]
MSYRPGYRLSSGIPGPAIHGKALVGPVIHGMTGYVRLAHLAR